jgi:hypothetical protein
MNKFKPFKGCSCQNCNFHKHGGTRSKSGQKQVKQFERRMRHKTKQQLKCGVYDVNVFWTYPIW